MISSRAKKNYFTKANKTWLHLAPRLKKHQGTSSEQSIRKVSRFLINKQIGLPLVVPVLHSCLFGGIMATAHRRKELPGHFTESEVTSHQFLTFGSKPDKGNVSPSLCIGLRHAPALRNTKYRDGYSTKSLDPLDYNLPRGHHKPEPLKLKA